MNRAELLARISRQLNKADVLDPRTQARLLDHINTRHRQIISAPGCGGLRRRVSSFTSVPGQARYALWQGEDIRHLRDTTNDRTLQQRSFADYRHTNPDPASTQGTPDGYVLIGFQPTEHPITPPAQQLFVVSSDAADTTQTVYLDGHWDPAGLGPGTPLNGTTPVPLGIWSRIDKLYLSALPQGIIFLHETTATGPTLARFLGETSPQYLCFYLDPTPSEALTYQVDVEYLIQDLKHDTSEPWIDSDFHDLLEIGAIIDELYHADDNRALVFQGLYDKRLGELKLKLARQQTPTGGGGRASRLGSWTPSGV